MINEVTSRPAEREDLPEITALAPAIWRDAYQDILSPEQISYMLDMMYSPQKLQKDLTAGVRFFLVCRQEKAVGFFAVFELTDDRSCLKLDKLYLASAFHGLGIGSMILEYITSRASDAGYSRIKLNVNKDNKRAIAAYSKNGFKKKESVKIDIGSGFFMDDYVMEKKLI